jgi:FkbM family methyltransferase
MALPELAWKEINLDTTEAIINNGFTTLRKYRHGFLMLNRYDTSAMTQSLELYGEWCEHELELAGLILRPGDIALDIGAAIGTHAVYFSQKVAPDGLVFAFEPQPILFQYLSGNLMLNSASNVIAIKSAVGAESGAIGVPIIDPAAPNELGSLSLADETGGEPAQLVRLDDMNFAMLRLIKIDVEGMELDVLKGASATLRNLRPYLFIDLQAEYEPRAIFELLEKLEYKCWWLLAACYNPENYYGNPNNAFSDRPPAIGVFAAPKERSISIEGMDPVSGLDDNWMDVLKRLNL